MSSEIASSRSSTGIRAVAVDVRNFRALRDVQVDLANYTVCIGANGAGKSSMLYALEWFFGGRGIDDQDRSVAADESEDVSVSVTFEWPPGRKPLTGALDKNGRIRVTRTWHGGKDESWATDGPVCADFADVRDTALGVAERRAAYRALREIEAFSELPERPGNAKIDLLLRDLSDWEYAHAAQLTRASKRCSASEAAAVTGSMTFVLVPASTDMSTAIDAGRSSLVDRLTGPLLSQEAEAICARWAARHETELAQLSDELGAALEGVAERQSALVNAELESLVPGVSVDVKPVESDDPAAWLPTHTPGVRVSVLVNGEPRGTNRQGHGVQRAVLMAMLQAAASAESEPGFRDPETAQEAPGPSTLIAIEEPEVYQHPQRARQIAAALSSLAERGDLQLIVATHSPVFVKPSQFSLLRRFSLDAHGHTTIQSSSPASVAMLVAPWSSPGDAEYDDALGKAERRLEKELPLDLSEGFFAERVILVEGPTDRVVIEAVAEQLGYDPVQLGVSFVRVSKDGIPMTSAILKALGIATYEVFDGDALGYTSKPVEKQAETQRSHQAASERLLKRLNLLERAVTSGHVDVTWQAATAIHTIFSMLHDDLEHELANWPSHQAARTSIGIHADAKDEAAVRRALELSRADDCPDNLTRMVRAALGV